MAAIRASSGALVQHLGDRYALTVHPFVPGSAGSFGPHPSSDREAVVDMLIALHRSRPVTAPRTNLRLLGRAVSA
ncbi:hypothetical protein ACGFJ7_38360 [Actinoplanes sp. NPDC048988]|uniref:hypothetical protein n=1 Tax=Actinoplanes sp. NPDC048988 TaxID=3363901 RepID=UPI00370FFA5D